MKYLICALALCFTNQVFAVVECGGRTKDGNFVTIQITTTGVVGVPEQGSVTIESGENKYGYRFGISEISQFFEYDEASDSSAVVGLTAFVQQESPRSVKYVGHNFVDMELKAVIDEGKVELPKGNFLRVWKGPDRAATDQYQLTKFVCSVWPNL